MLKRAGIYALIDLASGPVRADDAALLGLPATSGPITAQGVDNAQPNAVHVETDDDRWTLLLGFLDEPEALAASMALPAYASTIALARAAIARHGAEASRIMVGEWSLLDWTRRGGVTLMSSSARRDPIFYARRGARLAVAPDLDHLAKLDWVDRTIDPTGFLFSIGKYEVRRAEGDRTILGDVRRLECGATVRLDAAGDRTEQVDPFCPVTPFAGEFEEAMQEVASLMRRSMRQRLSRASGAASLLSGGLDSSLLALLGAEERAAGQALVCLTSAAPLDSGLADEQAFARIVADHLGVPMEGVAPPLSASIYRPTEDQMLSANQPSLSVRHYLYDALQARAEALNLPLILDGSFGEMTVTADMPVATAASRVRAIARKVLRRGGGKAAQSPFQVRIAPHRLAALPDPVAAAWRTAPAYRGERSLRGQWGYLPRTDKLLRLSSDLGHGRLRADYLFRDARLLELFASFPARFALHDGVARAPVKRMLKGHLPDSIRLRPKGLGFAPDYFLRLQTQALEARARIPAFRAADIDDWLDLDWLERKLGEFSGRRLDNVAEAFEVQLTAMTAEYLLWWQKRS